MTGYRRILTLALPILGGMLSQNVLDLVDTAMVGTLGAVSLAAVGLGAFANFMLTAIVLGAGSGVQTLVARKRGSGLGNEVGVPLNAGLVAVLALALPLSVTLIYYAPDVIALLNDDVAVRAEGASYLAIRLVGMSAVGANFCFRGYLNGIERSSVYLRVIILIHVLNVAISWVLIFGHFGFPAMGSDGAALGTMLSLWTGTAIYFVILWRSGRQNGFMRQRPARNDFLQILRISIPSSFQTLFFAAGLVALFWIIGHISVEAVAVSNVIVNLMKVGILPGLALGLAAMTLVSEAIGRDKPDEAIRAAWQTVSVAMLVMGLIALPGIAFPQILLGGFLDRPDLVELGSAPLRITACAILLDAVGMVLLNALIGASRASLAMLIAVLTQWLIGLPLCYLAATTLDWGLSGVWLSQAAYRLLQALLLLYVWKSGPFRQPVIRKS